MLILLIILVAILTITLFKVSLDNKEISSELEKEILKLENDNKTLIDKLEDLKLAHRKDRQLLIAEYESDSKELEYCLDKLAKFTEEQQNYYNEMDNINNHSKEMTPQELLILRSKVDIASSGVQDFTGIYILENKTVDKFYVGQSITVIRRVSSHFSDKGNSDIYEDFMNGEEWIIRLVALSNSGFKSINALEKHFIEYYHSTYNGYNKTIGNRT